jgi:hypothetical protein
MCLESCSRLVCSLFYNFRGQEAKFYTTALIVTVDNLHQQIIGIWVVIPTKWIMAVDHKPKQPRPPIIRDTYRLMQSSIAPTGIGLMVIIMVRWWWAARAANMPLPGVLQARTRVSRCQNVDFSCWNTCSIFAAAWVVNALTWTSSMGAAFWTATSTGPLSSML